jgi:hypothetical protein
MRLKLSLPDDPRQSATMAKFGKPGGRFENITSILFVQMPNLTN